MRTGDHCFDVVTSTDRSKLLEKFLRKRYNLVAETGVAGEVETKIEHCQLEFKTTRKRKVDSTNVRLGATNNIEVANRDMNETSTSQLLLGLGKPGVLDMEGRALNIECRKGASDVYQLIFSFSELNRSKVTSEVSLKRNEPLNVAQVINDLNNKSKTLGIPETIIQEAKGQESTTYELMIK